MILKISVLIAVYNVEEYLEKFFDSLFSNSYINKCEIIILNDCSTDKSLQKIIDITSRYKMLDIKIISNDENKGIGFSRAKLLKEATGDYIIFCDPDDWVEKDYIEQFYEKAKSTNADIIFCNIVKEFNNGTTKEKYIPIPKSKDEIISNYCHNSMPSWLHIKLIKRSIIEKNNISFEEDLTYSEDALFFIKVATKIQSFSYIDKVLYHYFQRNNSIVNSIIDLKKADSIVKSQNNITEYLKNNYTENPEIYKEMVYSKIQKKTWILLNGNKKVQSKYRDIFEEIIPYVNKCQIPFYKKIVIKNKNKFLASFILWIKSQLLKLKNVTK